MLILAIDTFSPVCGTALFSDAGPVGSIQQTVPNRHSEVLLPQISSLLSDNNLTLSDVSAVAVISGPGSFTGLRIGVSTAKGLCMGAGIPLIGIPVFDALAEIRPELANQKKKTEIGFLIDARQGDWYGAVLKKSGLTAPECKLLQKWKEENPEVTVWVAETDQDLQELLPDGIRFSDLTGKFCLAEASARLGFEWFSRGKSNPLHEFEPVYIKDFIVRVPSNPSLI